MKPIHRRDFTGLALALVGQAVSPALRGAAGALPIKKAVLHSMLPKSMPYLDQFKLAKACGFVQVECQTQPDQAEAEKIKKASDEAGLPIHSVMNMAHWKYPLS